MGILNGSKWAIRAITACLLASAGLPSSAHAGASQPVSLRNPTLPPSIPANGSSGGPIVSLDGRYVVFVSTANDLVTGDNSLLTGDVFVRDRQTGTTKLISTNMTGIGGGNGNSIAVSISTNNQFVLFESDAADLVPGDTNSVSDIFVRDLVNGTTTLVSVSTNGGSGNGASTKSVMTADGRYVAFVSLATNLIAGDTNGILDLFVRDLQLGTTVMVSAGASNSSRNTIIDPPAITPDGRYVAFVSSAKNLVGGMSLFPGDVFLRDLQAGTTTWVSTNHPTQSYVSSHPVISDDGRYVVFKQKVTNAVDAHIYRFDSVTGINTEINTNSAGVSLTNGIAPPYFIEDVFGPEISPDGRFVFYSASSNTAPTAILEWDAQSLSSSPVSVNTSGVISSNTSSHTPILSQNGRYLSFLSSATDMTADTVSNGFHVYVRDLQVGTNFLVDLDTNGIGSIDMTGVIPSLSADAGIVAFSSTNGGFVAGDTNQLRDVLLRTMSNSTVELVSKRDATVTDMSAGGFSWMSQASISADGQWLVFTSRAEDLVTNDTNGEMDVFVRNLFTGTTVLASIGTNGNPALGGYSGSPVITPDGRFVAFVSSATNMYSGDTNNAADIFVRDLLTSTTTLAFGSPGTVIAGGDSSAPNISADGRYLTFLCKSNTATVISYWRDIGSNQAVQLTNVHSLLAPSMSADGRYVAYSDSSGRVTVRDMAISNTVYSNPSVAANGMALSPDGTKLAYGMANQVFVTAITANSNILSFPATSAVRSQTQWSANSRYLAFTSTSGLIPGDNNSANDVFLCDTQTGTITLVSLNNSHTGSANGASESPALSGDGRFVVYRSLATDIVPGITNGPNLFLFDRLTGFNTLVSAESMPTRSWSTWISKPAISADGGTIAFNSVASGFAAGILDLNRNQDVFFAPQTPQSLADTDGDGIPDWWLSQYFGHILGNSGDLSRAQDGDGMSNLQEFLAGTSPVDSTSVFRLQITPVVASTNVILTWPTVTGKSYRVQYKNNLTDPVWTDQSGSTLVGGSQASFSLPANFPSCYLRVLAVNQ